MEGDDIENDGTGIGIAGEVTKGNIVAAVEIGSRMRGTGGELV